MEVSCHSSVPSNLPTQPVARLVGHDGAVQDVQFTASGKYCATAGADRSVRLWNPSRLDPAFPPSAQAYSQPGGLHRSILPETLPRALPIQTYTDGLAHPVSAVAVSEEASVLAAASDKTLVVYDIVTTKPLHRIQGQHYGRINAVALGPQAQTYLTASYDATVKLWDGRNRSSREPIQVLKDAKDSVTSVHVGSNNDAKKSSSSSSSSIIRTASVDGVVRTYDLRKGILQMDDMGSPITGMAPTLDGLCLAVSCLDGVIRLLEIESGGLLNTYKYHHKAGQFGLHCCLSCDDATIISGSEDGSAVLYDLVSAQPVQTLRGHSRPVCSVAAHPKMSSVIITAGYDGNCIVWSHDPDYMGWQ